MYTKTNTKAEPLQTIKEYPSASKSSLRAVQFPLSRPEAVEMQVEYRIPSSFDRNKSLQLSRYSINISTGKFGKVRHNSRIESWLGCL